MKSVIEERMEETFSTESELKGHDIAFRNRTHQVPHCLASPKHFLSCQKQAVCGYTQPALKRRIKMRTLFVVLIFLLPMTVHAEEPVSKGPLFMKDLVDEGDFFNPWGVGFDIFTMHQNYTIKSLQFQLPGAGDIDPSLIKVKNDVQDYDIKLDVWVTPFLNVFGLVGRVNAHTYVDLGGVVIPGLPVSLGTLPVSYDGTVYGGGANLVYGTKKWFAALNNTWTNTNVSGDFDSSARSFTIQPRLGVIVNDWTLWGGGMWLDTTEKHKGEISLGVPGLPPVPFNVELETAKKWNYAVGVGKMFGKWAMMYFELGFGDRKHTLFNFTYRF